jgi:divalent metal cation (Fe/Co/Zn/Cd) transporter
VSNLYVARSERQAGSRRLATSLLWITLAWNLAEGAIAVISGIAAASVALIGFGLDSFIEVTAAGILLWRLRLPEHDETVERRETTARRIVGLTFIVLAAYIGAQTLYSLITSAEPDPSNVGLVLSIVALIVMPTLGLLKRWNARRIGSRALIAESTETLLCAYLALTLFVGLAANTLAAWWWADIVAALVMIPWIAREGLEGLRGEADED